MALHYESNIFCHQLDIENWLQNTSNVRKFPRDSTNTQIGMMNEMILNINICVCDNYNYYLNGTCNGYIIWISLCASIWWNRKKFNLSKILHANQKIVECIENIITANAIRFMERWLITKREYTSHNKSLIEKRCDIRHIGTIEIKTKIN